MTEEQSKRDWEPKPGETVVVVSGGMVSIATERKVARLTATQIILEPLYAGADAERFSRKSRSFYGDDYPEFPKTGRSLGRFSRTPHLHHPDARVIHSIHATEARRDRVNTTLKAVDLFRRDRAIETAQKAVEALQEFIQHEEDASKG